MSLAAAKPRELVDASASLEELEAEARALMSFLLLVALSDGRVDAREEQALRQMVARVADAVAVRGRRDAAPVRERLAGELAELHAAAQAELADLADGSARDAWEQLVASRVRVRAHELFGAMEPAAQKRALGALEELLGGALMPHEQSLYRELARSLAAPRPRPAKTRPRVKGARMQVAEPTVTPLLADNHPVLEMLEQRFSTHPVELAAQLARDYALLDQTMAVWNRQREAGFGRLAHAADIAEVPADQLFLDRFTYAMRPSARQVDLIVLGDLHGCYSCLKAALLQTDFFARVWAHQRDPEQHPDVKLVFLGDYIDRGRFSFDGVLRAALQLFVSMPDHVVLLRGNHEYFLERDGFVFSGVHPADALNTLAPHAPVEMLDAYRSLFDAMPTAFLFDRTFFVHGGIPRDETLAARWQDLGSLNDPQLRFEMMWSDPAQTRHIPAELQKQSARFAFGVEQFAAFMERIGATTMIRGHERFALGFRKIYDQGDLQLLSLFSAGGADNADLPAGSGYRETTPMAASLRHQGGRQVLVPWVIEYGACQAPHRNRFHADRLELPPVSG